MKLMTDKEIDKIIENVQATLAVEDLNINKINIEYGKKYLNGQMSSKEIIKNITDQIKKRMITH
ncbi:MAG: hypothetical protein K9K76_06810 [Halanaerobiales bacterium]|nr:hypothetical protein [Halanaerobiales bacterium]